MNKDQFLEVLQAALLWFDEADPISRGLNPELAGMGIKLADYLKGYEVKKEAFK